MTLNKINKNMISGLPEDLSNLNQQLAQTKKDIFEKTYTKSINKLRNIVTFYFDDAPKADLNIIKPMADARGVPLSVCAIVDFIQDDTTYMNIDQLKALENDGWSVESHTVTHPQLDTLTDEQIEHELKASKEFFNANGIYPTSLCYPEGRYDERVLRIMRKYYDSGLSSRQGKNISPINQYLINRILVDQYTIDQLKVMVDEMNSEWYVFYSHNTTDFIVNHKAKFEQLMDYVISKGIDVLNFRDALKVFQNKIDIGDTDNTFKVGANGNIEVSSIGCHFLGNNSGVKNASPINFFPQNKTSICAFNSSENSGIPYSGGIGTLITYRIHNDDALAYQEFVPYNVNAKYSRKWNPATMVWGNWALITPQEVAPRLLTIVGAPLGSVPANSSTTINITVNGLNEYQAVSVTLLAVVDGLIIQPYVTAPNTLTLNLINTKSSNLVLNSRSIAISQ